MFPSLLIITILLSLAARAGTSPTGTSTAGTSSTYIQTNTQTNNKPLTGLEAYNMWITWKIDPHANLGEWTTQQLDNWTTEQLNNNSTTSEQQLNNSTTTEQLNNWTRKGGRTEGERTEGGLREWGRGNVVVGWDVGGTLLFVEMSAALYVVCWDVGLALWLLVEMSAALCCLLRCRLGTLLLVETSATLCCWLRRRRHFVVGWDVDGTWLCVSAFLSLPQWGQASSGEGEARIGASLFRWRNNPQCLSGMICKVHYGNKNNDVTPRQQPPNGCQTNILTNK